MNFHFKIRLSRWLNIREYIKSGPFFKKMYEITLHLLFNMKVVTDLFEIGTKKEIFSEIFLIVSGIFTKNKEPKICLSRTNVSSLRINQTKF